MKRLLLCVMALAMLLGCTWKLTPTLAQRQVVQDVNLNQAKVAQVGESFLGGLDSFGYASILAEGRGHALIS